MQIERSGVPFPAICQLQHFYQQLLCRQHANRSWRSAQIASITFKSHPTSNATATDTEEPLHTIGYMPPAEKSNTGRRDKTRKQEGERESHKKTSVLVLSSRDHATINIRRGTPPVHMVGISARPPQRRLNSHSCLVMVHSHAQSTIISSIC